MVFFAHMTHYICQATGESGKHKLKHMGEKSPFTTFCDENAI